MRRKTVRQIYRWLYIGHRWIGIATCLLFAIWFASGVVMMYVAFPALTVDERLASLRTIAWDKVRLSPDQAMRLTGLTGYPRELRLNMLDREPVYRLLDADGKRQTLSAQDGRVIDGIAPEQALAIVRLHPAAFNPQLAGTVERDQWSVTARFDPLRPMVVVALGDRDDTELYVSSRSGEIVLDTNRTERIWNWAGAIPHWIYFTALRKDAATWRQVVLWVSGLSLVVAVSGIWIGILRLRLRRRYSAGRITPYRGWMAWHHLTGTVAGILILTWMLSGWLSVNPFELFAGRGVTREMAQRYAGHDAPSISATLPAITSASAVEARFLWIGGAPRMLLSDRNGALTVADPASGLAVAPSDAQIFDAAKLLLPQAAIGIRQRLVEYDRYWYAHHQPRLLPVLRVGFDDAAQSWFHIDPRSGEIVGRSDASRRTYRWLFNALHSFDFPLLLAYRPAWDIVVVLLSLAGLVVSISGIVIGWRRLAR